MEQKDMDGLVSVVSTLGWKSKIKNVLGTDADAFYDSLVAQNPVRAYEVALQSQDPLFIQAVTKRIIRNSIGGTDLEGEICKMYLNSTVPAVPEPVSSVPFPASVSSSIFFIESFPNRYRVHGVSYQGSVSIVDISKALLDNGVSHVQADWIEMTRQGEWKLASSPLYFAVIAALYENRETSVQVQKTLVGEVRKLFAEDFKDYVMMTSTRIRYAREDLDIAIHDVGYATEHSEEASIVGVDEYINKVSGVGETTNVLLGTNDGQKVEAVGNWVTGKKSYLWCINSKPQKNIEHALVFNYDDDWFYIYAVDSFDIDGRARGMVTHSAENSP